ncbi:9474_t:CDS:2 [Funneliformis mosseae]|uniref:9474_t:CDS:1 n=1 Tax=Funneliformis mosseae TaxID=27381 RepID=A0A9N9D4C5_FUNMO|nr:9474_t:CDS:2 [Funneliformis mosseae]
MDLVHGRNQTDLQHGLWLNIHQSESKYETGRVDFYINLTNPLNAYSFGPIRNNRSFENGCGSWQKLSDENGYKSDTGLEAIYHKNVYNHTDFIKIENVMSNVKSGQYKSENNEENDVNHSFDLTTYPETMLVSMFGPTNAAMLKPTHPDGNEYFIDMPFYYIMEFYHNDDVF